MLSRRYFLAGTLAVGAASRLQAQTSDAAPRCCGLSAVTLRSTASRHPCFASASPTEPSGLPPTSASHSVSGSKTISTSQACSTGTASRRPGSKMVSPAFPDPQFRRAAAPTMISLCASAAPIGCIRIMGFRSSFCCRHRSSSRMAARTPGAGHRPRAYRFQLHAAGKDLRGSSGPSDAQNGYGGHAGHGDGGHEEQARSKRCSI